MFFFLLKNLNGFLPKTSLFLGLCTFCSFWMGCTPQKYRSTSFTLSLFKVVTQMPFNQAGLSWPTSLAIPILLILLYFLPGTVTIWHSIHSLAYSFVCFSLLKCKSHESWAFVLFTIEFLVTISVLEHGGCTLLVVRWMTKWRWVNMTTPAN